KLCREAESANRAKTEFLSNISHELRTPLTAILGYADMLAEEADPQARSQHLEVIRRQGRNLLTLVNDLVELSVLDHGNLSLVTQECRPWQVAEEVLQWVKPQADARGLAARLEYAFPMPSLINTDPRRLRQILLHLLSNAVKFTERGEVVLGVRWVKVAGGKSQIQFSVRDTGPGIDPDALAELFEPFRQSDGTSTRRHGGLGLGLTIAQRLIQVLGGTLEASSRPGEGSTFTVSLDAELLPGVDLAYGLPGDATLPADAARLEPAASVELGEPPHAPRGRILLVEDSPENRRLIERLLQLAGWEAETAENGLEAWQAALQSLHQGRPFDLILMDMQMPVMDGYQAAARLRQGGWRGPIVAVTAHASPDDREKCLKAGCDDYLTKPIRREVLVETVRQYLSPEHAAWAAGVEA
ncbi:MAG: response regulator, partial [Thermogutta sp.]|nr:response regulator [Thermogutta sp.]